MKPFVGDKGKIIMKSIDVKW